MIIRLLCAAAVTLCACTPQKEVKLNVEQALDYCAQQTVKTLDELGGDNYAMMPRNVAGDGTKWNLRQATEAEWCSGFWPGVLWYDYEYTNDSTVRAKAERYTEALGFLARTPAYDHDLGFLIFCSYGNGYRLTGNPDYKQVILATADTLARLFNPNVGTILSWPREVAHFGNHNTIMDNMINLEMLFWAAKNGSNKRLHDIAVAHADKTMQHHFRDDYTSYHVVVYDSLSGNAIRGCTHQGYSDSSMWARGQAWAIYGFTMCYRETNDTKYLDFARKVTDVYLAGLPSDYVPYWDFDSPLIPNAPRDASAAAIVASALLELSTYVENNQAQTYRAAAENMLASLSSQEYQSRDKNAAYLLHSTGHLPAGSEIDYSIIYADYYYIEALLRLKRLNENRQLIDKFS